MRAFHPAPPMVRVVSILLLVVGALLLYRSVWQVANGVSFALGGDVIIGLTSAVFAVFPVMVAFLSARAVMLLLWTRPRSRVGAMVQAGIAAAITFLGGPLVAAPIAIVALLLCLTPQVKSWSS